MALPKCTLCGEELTAPQIYKGAVYGWSCIKKVCPSARKEKVSPVLVAADSFSYETLENGCLKITAIKNGLKFNDYLPLGNPWGFKGIVENNGIAYIDTNKFKNGYKII